MAEKRVDERAGEGQERLLTVTFRSIPDRGRNIGWICWFGDSRPESVGVPIGRGGDIREAFNFMLDRLASDAIEKFAFERSRVRDEEEKP